MNSKPSSTGKRNGKPGKMTIESRPLFRQLVRNHLFDRRLANVYRWGVTPTIHRKSVAEHSFFVARIARRICEILKARNVECDEVNILRVVDIAMMHDEEEAFSGDIVHTFKHHNPQLASEIEKGASELLHSEYGGIPNGEYFVEVWSEYRGNKSIEAQIVRVADMVAGLAECEEEIRLGNREFEKLSQNYSLLLGSIDYPWFTSVKDTLTFRGV